MQDSNGRRADADESREKVEQRKAEATSDETLSDLEEAETDSSSTERNRDPGPSPDGALDESDEIKDAGPM